MTGDTRDRLAALDALEAEIGRTLIDSRWSKETKREWLRTFIRGDIAAGFGDTAALTAEVERLDGRFPHDGSEWRKGYDDALRLVRAALARTHDQERGA